MLCKGWDPGWRVAGVLYEELLQAAFPILIFLFGRYFPEPFPRNSRYDYVWRFLFWLCAVPFAVIALVGVVLSVGSLDNYHSVASLRLFLKPFSTFGEICAYVLIGSFFSAMGIKLGMTQSADAKRRLRFLYWGAFAAFTPGLLPNIYARLAGKNLTEIFPAWFIALILCPLVLFPLSLAYVIVVQKAMGVGGRATPGTAIHGRAGRHTRDPDGGDWCGDRCRNHDGRQWPAMTGRKRRL